MLVVKKFGGTSVGNKDRIMNVRSEEHTSELQSHTTISYAVFCLKKMMISLIFM